MSGQEPCEIVEHGRPIGPGLQSSIVMMNRLNSTASSTKDLGQILVRLRILRPDARNKQQMSRGVFEFSLLSQRFGQSYMGVGEVGVRFDGGMAVSNCFLKIITAARLMHPIRTRGR